MKKTLKNKLLTGILAASTVLGSVDADAQSTRFRTRTDRNGPAPVETGLSIGGAMLAPIPNAQGPALGGYLSFGIQGKVYGEVGYYDAQRQVDEFAMPATQYSQFAEIRAQYNGNISNLYVRGDIRSAFLGTVKLGIDFGKVRIGAGMVYSDVTSRVQLYQTSNASSPAMSMEIDSGHQSTGVTVSADVELGERFTLGAEWALLPELETGNMNSAFGVRAGINLINPKH
jgi:hypothetical protein